MRGKALMVIVAVAAGAAGATLGSLRSDHRVDARATASGHAPAATITDLMQSTIDPAADDVWNAVQSTVDHTGLQDKQPRTDDEWNAVRHGVLRLIEGSNLLLMPGRHVARPHEVSETPGVELEPSEMEALIDKDRAAWDRRVIALRDVSLEALKAVEARDPAAVFDVGDRIDTACENCHRQYWYPNEVIPALPAVIPAPAAPAPGTAAGGATSR